MGLCSTSSVPLPGLIASSHALVRVPGESYAKAISSTGARIDVALARRQHAEYCEALRQAGLTVEHLPPDEAHPDSCFMQDPGLVVGGHAVLCRMGAPSRAGEPGLVAERLRRQFPLHVIAEPGTLEGGDVIVTPGRIFVGESARTNAAGIHQLAKIVAAAGYEVMSVPVTKYLHLLSAVTYVGRNTVVALPDFAEHAAFRDFDVVTVDYAEAHAADALGVGHHVLLPAGNPRISAALKSRGFEILEIPLSAFAAADGGVTCLSLVW